MNSDVEIIPHIEARVERLNAESSAHILSLTVSNRTNRLMKYLLVTGLLLLFVSDAYGESANTSVDASTLTGKVMVGYQGWFNCEGDGSELGWKHWAKNRGKQMAPGNVTVDMWPDMSEYTGAESFSTGFKHADGSIAKVFSSYNSKTVARHFEWMRDYGIDGAFLQRFAASLRGKESLRNENQVLANVRDATGQAGRAYAVMYDLSGLRSGEVQRIKEDWSALQSELKLIEDAGYLHHNGKPLVAVWGIGFSDDRGYSLRECQELVEWLGASGCAVMIGVPSFWRDGERDAVDDPLLHSIMQSADVVCPWTVGRYRTPDQAMRHGKTVWQPDRQWCESNDLDFLPVIYPGFSWKNLHGGKSNDIPRLKGDFFWSQVEAAVSAECEMIYIAMFDEVDEGTAIFKCTDDPPVGDGASFVTMEGLPSDHYLKLAGRAGELLRKSLPVTQPKPR